jgi:hypothetical protein
MTARSLRRPSTLPVQRRPPSRGPYVPDPSISTQLQRLARTLGEIRRLLPETDSPIKQFRLLADSFQKGYSLVFTDLFRFLQSAIREKNEESIEEARNSLHEQIPVLELTISDLATLYSEAVAEVDAAKAERVQVLGSLVYEISRVYFEGIWRFCERSDREFKDLRQTVLRRIKAHYGFLDETYVQVRNRLATLEITEETVRAIGGPAFDGIRKARMAYLPVMQRLWAKAYAIDVQKAVLDVANGLCQFAEKTSREVKALEETNPARDFLNEECTQLYKDLSEIVKSFWALEYASNPDGVEIFGGLVVDFLSSENDEGRLRPLPEIAELFVLACQYHDAEAIKEMSTPIISPLIKDLLTRIGELRKQEQLRLWKLPTDLVGDDDSDPTPEEFERRKELWLRSYSDHVSEITRETELFVKTLGICHRSAFAYYQTRPTKPEEVSLPDFVEIEKGAIAKAEEYAASLAGLRKRIFDAIREAPDDKKLSDQELYTQLQDDERLQVDSFEQAERRTALEVIPLQQQLLVAAVHQMDAKLAQEVLKAMRAAREQEIKDKVSQRDICKKSLDVARVREFDEWLATARFNVTAALEPGISDALKDFVLGTIRNYRRNIAREEEKFANGKKALDKQKAMRLKTDRDRRAKAQSALEQTRDETLAGMELRRKVALSRLEKRVEVLIEAKEYAEAEAEKKQMESLRIEAQSKYELEQLNAANLHMRLARENVKRGRAISAQWYESRLVKLLQERDQGLLEQRRLFPAQLRVQLRRFAGWVSQINPQGGQKRVVFKAFDKTARDIVAENGLQELYP